jgi:hypothetical protein
MRNQVLVLSGVSLLTLLACGSVPAVPPLADSVVPDTEWAYADGAAALIPGRVSGPGIFDAARGTNEFGQVLAFTCASDGVVGVHLFGGVGSSEAADDSQVVVRVDSNDAHSEAAWGTVGEGYLILRAPSSALGEYTASIAAEALSATERIVVTVPTDTSAEPHTFVFDIVGLRESSAQLSCMNPGAAR